MATEIDGETNGCTFKWIIKNISHCWWLNGDLRSPSFIANGLEGTKWSLRLFRLGCTNESNIGFYLQRDGDCSVPKEVAVNFQLAFLGKDGSILKEKSLLKKEFDKADFDGFREFEERSKVFTTDRAAFLPEDTLTVQCTMWITNKKPVKSKNLSATTVIETKRTSCEWRISNFGTRKSDLKKKFVDYVFDFDIVLKFGVDQLQINMISSDESVKYISINSSIIDSEGEKTSCGIIKYFEHDLKKEEQSHTLILPKLLIENKSQNLPYGILSLDFEFVFSTFEHIKHRKNCNFEKEKADSTAILINEFQSLFNDGIFSDTELRTSTKTFTAHKAILSARSAVFRSMFSHDMKEANTGHVDIIDFEDDTVHRMLLYMYTAYLGDLQFESASKLYKIADKYQIIFLKSSCSSFFIESLCSANAGETLVLADLHHDDDMKNAVLDYILGQGKQFFCTQEWKDFMSSHNKLAGDIMYRKITMS